ncbi:MAG TPA: helix-turn-helix domain-containing protein [Polyangiales bacterium]|nr:helix-turn-helix domain-containing protein [Polyangiales bacterium]
MAEYRQYCPVARAAEILADRWTPLIVRELLSGSRHYNELLRGLPGISRSVLVSRLRLLADSGVLARREAQYVLTEAGLDLAGVIDVLGAWGARWAFGEPRAEELDPVLLLWKMHRRVRKRMLPAARTVVEFDLSGPRPRRLWLVMQRSEVSLCLKPPGFTRDLIVRADVALLYRVWLGQMDYHAALRHGLSVDGPRALVRALPQWLMWSPMARFVRAERRRGGTLRACSTPFAE